MNAWLADAHFLRPWWLLLVLAWGPLLWLGMRRARRGEALRRLVDARLLPHLLDRGGKGGRAGWLWWTGAALATLALAGPAWQRVPQPLYDQGPAQVVVVSLSPRMLATDVKPDRMQRVRYKVHDLLHANPAGGNALVAYTGEAFVVAPLSMDAHALDELVQALGPGVMPVGGDAPAAGIRAGARLLAQAGRTRGTLVLVTDTADRAARAAARDARKAGMRVSVLGVGSRKGSPVRLENGSLLRDADGDVVMARRDDASLRALAAAGGGIYVPMDSGGGDVRALAAEAGRGGGPAGSTRRQSVQWRDMGPWLLLPLVLLGALACRRGWLLLLPLVLLPGGGVQAQAAPSTTAMTQAPVAAASRPVPWSARWQALWRNGDQRAAVALREGRPERARRQAASPAMRGAAAYRSGDYAAAVRHFAAVGGAEADYNRGNALAKSGRYREALKAYDSALAQDPGLVDARVNRQAVQAWLRRQTSGKDGGNGAVKPGKARNGDGADASGEQQGPPAPDAGRKPSPSRRKKQGDQDEGTAPARQPEQAPSAAGSRAGNDEAHRKTRPATPRGRRRGGGDMPPDNAFDLGRQPAAAGSTLPAPMEQALERVRDDPGGLLRRKFELQYRQRRNENHGGTP